MSTINVSYGVVSLNVVPVKAKSPSVPRSVYTRVVVLFNGTDLLTVIVRPARLFDNVPPVTVKFEGCIVPVPHTGVAVTV